MRAWTHDARDVTACVRLLGAISDSRSLQGDGAICAAAGIPDEPQQRRNRYGQWRSMVEGRAELQLHDVRALLLGLKGLCENKRRGGAANGPKTRFNSLLSMSKPE